MLVRPADLDDGMILAGLRDGWGISAETIRYLPVGFGSHHWRADKPDLFVTVDDLDKQRRQSDEARDTAFARLSGAFGAAYALRHDAGLTFVVAPVPDRSGRVLGRLSDRYSLVVHPFVRGHPAGPEAYASRAQRHDVVDLLVEMHRATDVAARYAYVDEPGVPNGEDIAEALDDIAGTWDGGPYGDRARRLLDTHARGLIRLLRAHDDLAVAVAGESSRVVISHGEPSAGNVVVNDLGLHLVDWESARVAPLERDLWSLAEEDPAILDRYAARSGRSVDTGVISYYRLWYDLFEIGGYLRLFRHAHADDPNAAESWKNLQFFLRPAERWPNLVR